MKRKTILGGGREARRKKGREERREGGREGEREGGTEGERADLFPLGQPFKNPPLINAFVNDGDEVALQCGGLAGGGGRGGIHTHGLRILTPHPRFVA
jgi:hypothetical protein